MVVGVERQFPVSVGEFIHVPAWSATGCVMSVSEAPIGSEETISILLQEYPDQPSSDWKRYYLEPGSFEFAD